MDGFPLGTVSISKTPKLYQANCERCGWHTRQCESELWVREMARVHFPLCPNPRYRDGALMECGCWWLAPSGSAVGFTKAECPIHGLTMMEKANVTEAEPYGTGAWRPAGGSMSTDGEGTNDGR